jgi:hypothetical protein
MMRDHDCVKVLLRAKGTDIYLGVSSDGRACLYGACCELLWIIGPGEAELFGKIHRLFGGENK